jgi:hypothetical protein
MLIKNQVLERIVDGKFTLAFCRWKHRIVLFHVPNKNEENALHRIKFHFARQNPREVLREQVNLTDEELAKIHQKLTHLDFKSQGGSWIMTILRLIKRHPGLRAIELAALAHLDTQVDTQALKVKVRKLKRFGLTVSIERGGYRLSPSACEMLNHLDYSGEHT